MWPFKKKDNFDLESLEKELNSSSSAQPKTEGLSLQAQPQEEFEDDDGGFAKTTKDERRNMAKSFSNSEEGVMLPSSHAPVSNISSEPQYPSSPYAQQYNDEGVSQSNFGSQHYAGQANLSTSSDNTAHKLEIMEKQIEILSSKIELLKVNIESINSKLYLLDQKVDKKLSNPWM